MTERKISGLTATNIVVANMIGTGVFVSLHFQVMSIHSDFALIFLWILGGFLSLCGALCYAELAVALPRLGGEYNFLSRIYHPSLGFMAGWISSTVGFPAPIALAAIAFAQYLQGLVPFASPVLFSFTIIDLHSWFPALPPAHLTLDVLGLISLGIVWLVTIIQLAGIRTGARFQNVSTIVKIGLILCLIGAGIFFFPKQAFNPLPASSDLQTICSFPYAISMFFVMYSFSGWNGASYITSEVRDPEKNVPWALFVGTLTVTVVYTLLNWVFLIAAPRAELADQLQVAATAGGHIFGTIGGRLASGLISFGLIASVSAMSWIGSRVTKAMADDFRKLRFLGRVNPAGTPEVALVLQALIVSALILTGSFEAVLVYTQFVLLLSSFLAVLGLIVLRVSQPKLPRPYRVWGYPLTPLIFIAVTLWMMIYSVHEKPLEALLGLATALAGLVIYFFIQPATRSY
jgi:basic amino acid/polyamine antiporter, APA family